MPINQPTSSKHYALTVALIYLLVRGIPDLILFVLNVLPEDTVISFLNQHRTWLLYLYPILPLRLAVIPQLFHDNLTSVLPWLLETLSVFLFSAWFIRRKPWIANTQTQDTSLARRAMPWAMLILATLVWSVLIRLQLLDKMRSVQLEELMALRDSDDFLRLMPAFLMKAYWSLASVLYISIPLWGLLPVWIHFRFAGHHAQIPQNTSKQTGISPAMQQAVVFAAFLLGFLLLHSVLLQAIYMKLWPWVLELADSRLPYDMLADLGLSLTLSQIVFACLAGALAAYTYTRSSRLADACTNSFSAAKSFVQPALTGMAAYLLTCLILLALLWLVSYLLPDAMASTLRKLESDNQQNGLFWLIGVNILSLLLLCLVSNRLRASPRLWYGVTLALLVCFSIPVYVSWTLTSIKLGIAGGKPGDAITGELGDARWRNMESECTGVIETRHATWLIGAVESRNKAAPYVPDGTPDLSALIHSQDKQQASTGLLGSRSFYLTTLSRLQDDGKFKLEATVPAIACMIVSPDTETLYLLTGLKTPQTDLSNSAQDAVLRSNNHGSSWEWLESGFMAEAGNSNQHIRPIFDSDQSVWAWGPAPSSENETADLGANGIALHPTGLFHSSDQGKTSTPVLSSKPLIAPDSLLRELSGIPDGAVPDRTLADRERFVVQISDKLAYVWVTESLWQTSENRRHRLILSTRATLSRASQQEQWQVTKVEHRPNELLKHVTTSADGQTYATLVDSNSEWLVRLNKENGEWDDHRALPEIFPTWLVNSSMEVLDFWSNGTNQVIRLQGYVKLARLLAPFSKKPPFIMVDTHYYTRDGGRSWHQLAIPRSPGVMGLSPHSSKLYWSKGNWYREEESIQRHYELMQ